jgi:peptide-methionine (S)-S-oxide reductase
MSSSTSVAVFGLGCLWGADPVFGALDGVRYTLVGFAGGTTPDPTHAAIGDHIEAVRVVFDPVQIAYSDLLRAFWTAHDPTETAAKRRYRHALVPQTDRQAEQARTARTQAAKWLGSGEHVRICEHDAFHVAAPCHQNYKLRTHDRLAAPFRNRCVSDEAFARSPAATLANAYVAGHRPLDRLDEDRGLLALPAQALDRLRDLARRHQGWRAFVRST